tara:strand:- start:665 stop:772 length:108 start_codon:yes stop_codon:yes gene_type:complete
MKQVKEHSVTADLIGLAIFAVIVLSMMIEWDVIFK